MWQNRLLSPGPERQRFRSLTAGNHLAGRRAAATDRPPRAKAPEEEKSHPRRAVAVAQFLAAHFNTHVVTS